MKPITLSKPPVVWKTLGPSFILLGLALGSGELILWPFLTANWGLGLLWGALLGITLQFFLNTEVIRYSLSWSESVFVGFRKLSPILPVWFILSTVIPWSLPGFSSATAEIMHSLFPAVSAKIFAIGLLLLVGFLLSFGKSLYKTMVRFQTIIIVVSLATIVYLVARLSDGAAWSQAALGLVGHGDGWWFFPAGVKASAFLAAFAYAGAGGNLNLAQTYYIREKGFGMGAFASKITGLLSKSQSSKIRGSTFPQTAGNIQRWKHWWHFTNLEHALIFWFLGLATIILLAILSYSTVFGQEVSSGLSFLHAESAVIGSQLGSGLGVLFLVIAAFMLFSTQLGVLESSSRIISENISLMTNWRKNATDPTRGFAALVWFQIAVGIIVYLSGMTEPRALITLSAILNAAAMMVSFGLLFFLNRRSLQPAQRIGNFRKFVLLFGVVFFLILLAVTVFGW
ncbi:MAG: hypothetical protein GW947_01525 [Candidatus Pacebacteria bacterium]|nr:hypothetical protein [Candidatus Paceibacterota bacterium]PIR59795.1 MAG: hypothetical protein COU68_03700 [Candidatus Pacebacteria bacterium CG10_big_fil_rev_8_21_14_0_10_45_6]